MPASCASSARVESDSLTTGGPSCEDPGSDSEDGPNFEPVWLESDDADSVFH